MSERTRDTFTVEAAIEWDAAGVPTVHRGRAGLANWEQRLRKHKPHGRRRMSRDAVRATEAGAR
jgi:hypothetical protein